MKITKILSVLILIILIVTNALPVFAIEFYPGQTIRLKKDHECTSVLKMKGQDLLKGVVYVVYEDQATGKKLPAFCVEPSKEGIGTGAGDEYDVTLDMLDNQALWRILFKGFMGSKYSDWGLECEDDLYYATKTAVHCLVDGINPKGKYEVPNRVGWGEEVTLEEVQRRGTKVLDVAEELYNYGINGQENYVQPQIELTKESEKVTTIDSEEFLLQEFRVTGNREIDGYNIGIEGLPDGTKILDVNGNETYDMESDIFKVAVPVSKIDRTLNENIFINGVQIKTYPVFYAIAYKEELQDYIIYPGETEYANAEFNLKIIPAKSNLKVIKQDEETKKPIAGVKFNAKYSESGENIGDYITDENGEIEIPNLRPEKITLTELETLEQYELNNTPLEIKMNYGENKEITIYNKYKKGKLKVIKTDKEDDSIKLKGVEFDLIDKDSNIVGHLVTNEDGEALLDGINIGDYILRETKTKEEYKISLEDKNVTIKWNEESVVTISNEKKKGQIEVVKVDKEDNTIKLKGVEFEVLDKNDNVVDKIITDENGTAKTKLLPIGTYYLREISTDDKHILNDKKIETIVKEDVTASVIVENERIKGQIKIVKTSEDKNNILNLEAGAPIEGAKFNIYNAEGKLVDQVVTNKDGIAITKKLDKGKYSVQEIETGKWYILNEEKFNIEIKENNEIVELDITNKSENPGVDIEKESKNIVKNNEEIDYEFTIKNTGNTKLTDFTWYDILPNQYAKITKIETGTFNQDITYSIYYKTNRKADYLVLKKDLNSKENNYIDLTNIYLEEGEEITEIKVCFGEVDVGFSNEQKPHIYMKLKDNLENDTKIENFTILEGYDKDYKVTDEDETTGTVYNVEEKKKLPRTGF